MMVGPKRVQLTTGTRVLVGVALAALSAFANRGYIGDAWTQLWGGPAFTGVREVPVFDDAGALTMVDTYEAEQGFIAGRYRLSRGRVGVRLRDGSVGTVNDTEAQRVLDAGGHLASPAALFRADAHERWNQRNRYANPLAMLGGVALGLLALACCVYALLSLVRIRAY